MLRPPYSRIVSMAFLFYHCRRCALKARAPIYSFARLLFPAACASTPFAWICGAHSSSSSRGTVAGRSLHFSLNECKHSRYLSASPFPFNSIRVLRVHPTSTAASSTQHHTFAATASWANGFQGKSYSEWRQQSNSHLRQNELCVRALCLLYVAGEKQ